MKEINCPSLQEPIFQVIRKIFYLGKALNDVLEQEILSEYNLSKASIFILHFLSWNGEMTISELQEINEGHLSNMSQRVSFLQKRGLVCRGAPDEADRRKVPIRLTPEGKRVEAALFARIKDFHRECERRMPEKDLQKLLELLEVFEKKCMLQSPSKIC